MLFHEIHGLSEGKLAEKLINAQGTQILPWKIPGKIMEYCQFRKVATLSKFNVGFYYEMLLPAKLLLILLLTNRQLLQS